MKALSIKQPWASLIVHGIKNIENRTWKTKYRGRIYIHVSTSKFTGKGHPFTPEQLLMVQHSHRSGNFPSVDELPYSAIIGEVSIIDCVINHQSVWAEQMETYKCEETGINILYPDQKYIWNWVLENPILYNEPILSVKGKLSLWEFNNGLIQ